MKYAFINGHVLSGHEDMKPEDKVIFVDGEKIVDIKDAGCDTAGYEVIDLKGQYILPGLINMHVHIPASGKPKKGKTNYNAKSNCLTTIEEGTKASFFNVDYKGEIIVQNPDGKVLNKKDKVVTGTTITVKNDKKTYNYTVSISGDVNGDGKVSAADYTLIKNNIMGKKGSEFNVAQGYAAEKEDTAKRIEMLEKKNKELVDNIPVYVDEVLVRRFGILMDRAVNHKKK